MVAILRCGVMKKTHKIKKKENLLKEIMEQNLKSDLELEQRENNDNRL